MRPRNVGPPAAVLFVLIGTASAPVSAEPLTVVEEYMRTQPHRDEVDVAILFSREVDFLTVDEHDRQADAFQYYFPDFHVPNLLIRGGEIHDAPSVIPIRPGFGAAITTTVPYVLDGPQLTFTVPLADLDRSGVEVFPYFLLVTEFGAATEMIDGIAEPHAGIVPEPASWGLVVLGVVGVMGWKARRGIR